MQSAVARFAALPTAAKLLLILTAVLLPIGTALTWVGEAGIQRANAALDDQARDDARAAAHGIESLVARNALALRVAAAGSLREPGPDSCRRNAEALSIVPAISQRFSLQSLSGELICTYGGFVPRDESPLVAPGDIQAWVDANGGELNIRVGVGAGMATTSVDLAQLRTAALSAGGKVDSLELRGGERELAVIEPEERSSGPMNYSDWPIARTLIARVATPVNRITTGDRLMLLLPVLMWVLAALVTWLLVSRLLIRPLKRLQQSVSRYVPGQGTLELPRKLGPSREIQEVRDAFERAVARVEESGREMASALEGQQRLVREVHHRVKNNLQVIASLLNIHGRSAETPEAQGAYAGIGRRVGALSIVHRNHFAEMEENRGISLRPLLSELGAELRSSAPESARRLAIDLDAEQASTTQDVAVAVAFLVTEIVEYAMLHGPPEPIEVSLRRTSELTARLTISSPVLVPEGEESPEKKQFERIVAGLAKQLRSPLDRRLGRYSVDLPVFPVS